MKTIALKIKESRWTTRLLSPVILVLLIVVFRLLQAEDAATPETYRVFCSRHLLLELLRRGAVFIFSTGNVNISMGAATALVATIAANAYLATGSLPVMFTVAVIAGVVVLSLTALLSTVLNIRVLFVTVVMMTLLASIQKAILGSNTLKIPYEVTSALNDANTPLIIFVLFFLFCTALFHFTALGRKLRYIGINEICAELTGFKQSRYLFIAFCNRGHRRGFGRDYDNYTQRLHYNRYLRNLKYGLYAGHRAGRYVLLWRKPFQYLFWYCRSFDCYGTE